MLNKPFQIGEIKGFDVYREAWDLIKDQYWMIFAITIVGILLGSFLWIVLMGPMICGIYLCLFDKYDGREVSFERLFQGFNYFLPSFLVCLVIVVPMIVVFALMYIPLIGMAMAGQRMSEEELFIFLAGVLIFEFIVIVLMTMLHTLLLFSFQLIVDRKCGAWEAIKLSASAVWNNLAGVSKLMGATILVGIAGYLLLCIGIYLAIPLIFAANTVAYRKVFPKMPEPNVVPPPPGAYRGL